MFESPFMDPKKEYPVRMGRKPMRINATVHIKVMASDANELVSVMSSCKKPVDTTATAPHNRLTSAARTFRDNAFAAE